MSFASTCKIPTCNKFTDDPSNLCTAHQEARVNDICGSCGKPNHPGGCKLGPASPQEQVKLDQHSRVSDPKNTCGICMATDHATPACPKATYVEPEWFPPTTEEMKARTEAALGKLNPRWKPVPKEREDDAEKVAQMIEEHALKADKDFLYIGNLHPAMADLLRECIKVQGSKGRDYTEGSDDRLNNFREAGEETDTPMEKVWYVYFFKHWKAVRSWVRFGQVESEPIRGRIVDCINYLLLLWLIVCEKDPNQD